MKLSNLKVRTRLLAGLSVLLIMCVCVGVFAVRELGKLNETVHQLTTEDWETIQGATTLRSSIRTVAARSTELLLADPADRPNACPTHRCRAHRSCWSATSRGATA